MTAPVATGLRSLISRAVRNDAVNFGLTNYLPRRLATKLMGRFSKIEHPWVRDLSVAAWRLFTDLDLREAKKAQSEFRSLHECFTRELKPGARPVTADPAVLVCPSDGIVGACGHIDGDRLLQAKGRSYTLAELLCDANLARAHEGGRYVTLRLTSAMYHRFHAPYACRVEQVAYVPGDVWNVNPPALARVDKLFCRNERAVIRCRLEGASHRITLVPVAAILVASLRLKFLDLHLHLGYDGPRAIACDAPLAKGEEMGWFEHGSTIIVLAPPGFDLAADIETGVTVRMGAPLLRMP